MDQYLSLIHISLFWGYWETGKGVSWGVEAEPDREGTADDLDACKRAAMMYSLFGACKVLDKNPERWLCIVCLLYTSDEYVIVYQGKVQEFIVPAKVRYFVQP